MSPLFMLPSPPSELETDFRTDDTSIGKSASRKRGSILSLFGWKSSTGVHAASVSSGVASVESADDHSSVGTVTPYVTSPALPGISSSSVPLPPFAMLPSALNVSVPLLNQPHHSISISSSLPLYPSSSSTPFSSTSSSSSCTSSSSPSSLPLSLTSFPVSIFSSKTSPEKKKGNMQNRFEIEPISEENFKSIDEAEGIIESDGKSDNLVVIKKDVEGREKEREKETMSVGVTNRDQIKGEIEGKLYETDGNADDNFSKEIEEQNKSRNVPENINDYKFDIAKSKKEKHGANTDLVQRIIENDGESDIENTGKSTIDGGNQAESSGSEKREEKDGGGEEDTGEEEEEDEEEEEEEEDNVNHIPSDKSPHVNIERIELPLILHTLFACLPNVESLDLVHSTVRTIELSVTLPILRGKGKIESSGDVRVQTISVERNTKLLASASEVIGRCVAFQCL